MYELQTEGLFTYMLEMNPHFGGQLDVSAHELSDQRKKTLGSLKYEGARSKGDIKAYAEKHPELTQEALPSVTALTEAWRKVREVLVRRHLCPQAYTLHGFLRGLQEDPSS